MVFGTTEFAIAFTNHCRYTPALEFKNYALAVERRILADGEALCTCIVRRAIGPGFADNEGASAIVRGGQGNRFKEWVYGTE